MLYDTRLSLDTLYFGLSVLDLDFQWAIEEIKNYLFFNLDFNYEHSRSKFYHCEAISEENGFYMFFSPKKNILNDYATIQVTGKFFREEKNLQSLKKIFDLFNGHIRYQRVDVALDIMYLRLPDDFDTITNNLGFPFPRYSANWNNVKLEFMTYGRVRVDRTMYINMVSCGRGDFVLRVYDKELDLQEKYEKSYSEYYGFEQDFQKVFRIEYQMRGKGLGEFCNNAIDLGIDIFDIDKLCGAVMSCVFHKFQFEYLDSPDDVLYIPTSSKRKSTLQGRLEFHRNKEGFHYFRYYDLYNQKLKQEEEEKGIKEIAYNLAKDKVSERIDDLKDFFDCDFEKVYRNEFKQEYKNILKNDFDKDIEIVPF